MTKKFFAGQEVRILSTEFINEFFIGKTGEVASNVPSSQFEYYVMMLDQNGNKFALAVNENEIEAVPVELDGTPSDGPKNDSITLGSLVSYVQKNYKGRMMDLPMHLELPDGRYELVAHIEDGAIVFTEKEDLMSKPIRVTSTNSPELQHILDTYKPGVRVRHKETGDLGVITPEEPFGNRNRHRIILWDGHRTLSNEKIEDFEVI